MMIEKIGAPAMLEQLAEEATELAKSALKMARVLRGENPTPITRIQAFNSLAEEYTDTVQCANELCLTANKDQMMRKELRFKERWNQMKKEEIINE